MVNKCCIVGCRSNYAGEISTTPAFSFPADEELRKRWIKFVNRKEWKPRESSVICIKHFDEKYIKTGKQNKRNRLNKSLKPIPTLNNATLSTYEESSLSPVYKTPRKSPVKRTFQEDQYESFLLQDEIKTLACLDEQTSPEDYLYKSFDNHIIYYKLVFGSSSVPEVTDVIRIDENLHVKLFYKGAPLPLPNWFRHGHNCVLNKKSMLENFPSYFKSES